MMKLGFGVLALVAVCFIVGAVGVTGTAYAQSKGPKGTISPAQQQAMAECFKSCDPDDKSCFKACIRRNTTRGVFTTAGACIDGCLAALWSDTYHPDNPGIHTPYGLLDCILGCREGIEGEETGD
jgi:hypothetical protein